MLPLIAQVRDRNLARVGILTDDDLAGLKLFPARNDVGTWELTLPHTVRDAAGRWVRHAMAEELAKPGAGIIIELPGGRRFSGPVLTPSFTESTEDSRGSWTFTGVSDAIVLADRLAFPDPTKADAQESSASRAYDARTGTAENLLHAFVRANLVEAPAPRADGRFRMGDNGGRGGIRTKSARFVNLLELCQELAVTDGLLFDVVQVGDTLEFQTAMPRDLTATIRMDIEGDTLAEASYAYSGPRATSVIVLGKGEAEDRLIRTRTAADAEALVATWGRRIEAVVDARGSEEAAELDAKGDEVLAEAGLPVSSLDVTPSDVNARELGLAWWLGDLVTVNVAGQAVKAAVTRVRIDITPDGINAGATVGDAVGFDPTRVTGARVTAVESRVSALERTTGTGSERSALLPKSYLYRNAVGATPVILDGELTPYALEWDTPYNPSGARSVRIRLVGDRWRIQGQTYEAKDLHPLAGEYPLQIVNDWWPYDERYNSDDWADGRAIVLPSGIVNLSGLILKNGGTANNEVIARMPAAIAPDSDQYFAISNSDVARGVVIKSNGDIMCPGTTIGANTYVSLDRISYPAKGVAQWTEVGAPGSGSSWGPNFEDYLYQGIKCMYWKDPYGFVWWRGLAKVKVAGSGDNANLVILPTSHRTAASKGEGHFRSVGNDGYAGIGSMSINGINYKAGTPNAVGNWISLAGLVTPSADALGTTLNNWWRFDWMTNSWNNHGALYPDAGVTRREDGLVCWRGLISGGIFGAGIGRMPNEAIPRETRLVDTISNQNRGRVDFWGLDRREDALYGTVYMNNGSNAWFSFDGITYAP
ncbi:minor tail protein [Microbacterium phage Cen1621]|uniref:Minor tail protein n=1 Tax=Microbacterium phage Cen1621 TaxID=2965191 RepID=A0A9E7TWU6_9CAUD|nr:minor tail protein [Microbacterium phage Cen1621]